MSGTMNQMKQRIDTMNAQVRTAAAQLSTAAMDDTISMDELNQQRKALTEMQARRDATQEAYDLQCTNMAETLPAGGAKETPHSLRDMLKSNEYARAFAYAVRNGITPKRGVGDEHCRVLYDALTIGGGDPAGEDGGFLVPEDIDHTIRELRRTLNPLADLFTVEPVSTSSGWRVQDKAPTTGMSAVDEMAIVPQNDQPAFSKIPYSLTKYGLIIPVSSELASDEVANLFGYLAGWFAKKQILTENGILRKLLELLTGENIATDGEDDEIAQIKTVLNKTLDPAISLNAVMLTNQSGYNHLDSLTDKTGRPMLQPDPTNATGMLFKGRRISMVADTVLPNQEVEGDGDYYPMYIGDFKQYATLFVRHPLEIVSTDIGGNAFRSDSIEVRGITRLGASRFDKEAVARRNLYLPE